MPEGVATAHLAAPDSALRPVPDGGTTVAAEVNAVFDPALSWQDLDWLASLTPLPLVLKGVLHPSDARRAVEHGARGLVVSNHGGRQLDSAVATLDALPAVVDAVAGRAEVLLDGGIRRGTDVLKALALGARAVLIGRPPCGASPSTVKQGCAMCSSDCSRSWRVTSCCAAKRARMKSPGQCSPQRIAEHSRKSGLGASS